MNNRAVLWKTIGSAALGLILLISCSGGEESTVDFFYEAVCPSCEETQRMEALAGEVMYWGTNRNNTSVKTYDIFHTANAIDTLYELCDKYGVDTLSLYLPVLFVDGAVYQGLEDIKELIKSAKN